MSSFYNATYFQNVFNSRDFKDVHSDEVATESSVAQTITKSNGQSRSINEPIDLIGTDVTAAQLYESIEDNFAE